ncbi:Phox homologous domain [Macleaya cordata]|uniref:Phox homologous domain n=1 Tax=Macleaya cordata TaxID=56857 RepID=A0A200RDE6_MACCD|nr:Phox homologous domain [Macleaya cordata]
MINGEGTGENFSTVASPDRLDELPLWEEDQMLEAGNDSPASSEYSSYGESEFEKYCSANSFMGTASMCSSLGTCNDFLDSDLGSLKSLRFDDDRVLENFGSGVRLGRNSADKSISDDRIEFRKQNFDVANGVSIEEERAQLRIKTLSKFSQSDENLINLKVKNVKDSRQSSDMNTSSSKDFYAEDNGEGLMSLTGYSGSDMFQTFANDCSSVEVLGAEDKKDNMLNFGDLSHSSPGSTNSPLKMAVREENCNEQDLGCFNRLTSVSNDLFDGRETGRVLDGEEGTSSKYEHSDDEGSMFGYGTDDEQRVDLYERRNLQFRQVAKKETGNPLLINSAVAFGSDDWNDFEQETEEDGLASALWIKPQEQRQRHLGTERKLLNPGDPFFVGSELKENLRDIPAASCQVHDTDESLEDLEKCYVTNILAKRDPLILSDPSNINLNILDAAAEKELRYLSNEGVTGLDESELSETHSLGKSALQLDLLSDITVTQLSSSYTEGPRGKERSFEDHKPNAVPPLLEDNHGIGLKRTEKDSPMSLELGNDHLEPIKVENPGSNESYDDLVLEMEEILLDSSESHGARFPQGQGNRLSLSQLPQPFRDGSSTASTSGTDDVYPVIQPPLKIDGVEVVGAKQKKGDVSLGERLVGVKEYTVYKIRVWSGMDQWEVERRYRDFYTLYRQLKRLFADLGWTLPSPWSRVEQESRKIFGNASPGVVSERSALIQECLRSILHSGSLYSTPTSLIWFLSPQKVVSSSSMLNALEPPSTSEFSEGTFTEDFSSLGKTISLLVRLQPPNSVKQLLEAQHYTCAGCHKHFNSGKTLMKEFVQTLGWGKPRLCEYTSQLFCASCHTNDTAVLPARVLHLWDFTEYPISQLAKSYLESIYDQPMLCVSAVNPFLFSKVPTLLHVMGVRKKIGAMLPYLRCPFRRTVNRGMGSRRYLLESNDFFALRDLVDLSKGAFAVLPVMLETVSRKILEHITQQCLVCCDVGVPCGARQACEDTSSLIFPFQESEVDRCSSCESVFHKPCFKKLDGCLCGASSIGSKVARPTDQLKCKTSTELDGSLDVSTRRPDSRTQVGFLSSLFSRARPDTMWGSKKSNPVILMGSLPSTSL